MLLTANGNGSDCSACIGCRYYPRCHLHHYRRRHCRQKSCVHIANANPCYAYLEPNSYEILENVCVCGYN